jgi:lipoate---protein ligase
VVINGQRVASVTGTYDGLTLVFQGFVHLDFDKVAMIDALAPPGRGRAGAEFMRMAERSAGLSDFLGRVPSAEEIVAVLASGMSNELRLQWVPGEASAAETVLAARRTEEAEDPKVLAMEMNPKASFVSAARRAKTAPWRPTCASRRATRN